VQPSGDARGATMHLPPDAQLADVHAATERYYSRKALIYGPTPTGVDWPSAESQELRISQLLNALSFEQPCSLNDLGCGYGAALKAILKLYPSAEVDYLGIDLSPEMVRLARLQWGRHAGASFTIANTSPRVADYSIASGIFNVKLECTRERWEELVRETLKGLSKTSRCGFAVNFLATNRELEIPELYRTPAEPWVKYCKSEWRADVDVISGYSLPEFTLVLRKASVI